MPRVNMLMQPKGGVGKSFIAALIAEHKALQKVGCIALDTDLSNGTFAGYSEFDVQLVPILKGRKIVQAQFDVMMAHVLGTEQDVVIDTGANTFHPLAAYMLDNNTMDLLAETGRTLALHVPLTSSVGETVAGLQNIVRQFVRGRELGAEVFVWFNGVNGPLVEDGVPVEETTGYREVVEDIVGVVNLPKFEETTGDAAIKKLIQERRSFSNKIADPATDLILNWRLRQLRETIMAGIVRARI